MVGRVVATKFVGRLNFAVFCSHLLHGVGFGALLASIFGGESARGNSFRGYSVATTSHFSNTIRLVTTYQLECLDTVALQESIKY